MPLLNGSPSRAKLVLLYKQADARRPLFGLNIITYKYYPKLMKQAHG